MRQAVSNGTFCGKVGQQMSIPRSMPSAYYEVIIRARFFVAADVELGARPATGEAGIDRCKIEVSAIDDACHSTMTCEDASTSALFPLTFVHDNGVLRVTSASTRETWIAPMSPDMAYGCITLGEMRSKKPMALCFDVFGGLDISVPGTIYSAPPTRTPRTPAL
ncbi:MAG: hypothetical protein SFX73_19205 [Kofleriaceae bacterium]|nr:hypothetical protein [Kofleriaceae bacterium]